MFRHAQYYDDDRRTLYKAYGGIRFNSLKCENDKIKHWYVMSGLRFIFEVSGSGGKFNLITIFELGSVFGLVGIVIPK